MERIELPSGGWVELKDPKTLKARDKKAIMKAVRGVPDAENPVGFAVDISDGLIAHMIENWYVPYLEAPSIPLLDPSVLDELEIPDYDALTDAIKPAQELLFSDAVTPDDHDKPGSPTPPAAA